MYVINIATTLCNNETYHTHVGIKHVSTTYVTRFNKAKFTTYCTCMLQNDYKYLFHDLLQKKPNITQIHVV